MIGQDLARALDPARLMRDCGFVPDPWQAQVLRAAAARTLLLCSRQSGKSQTTAALALHTALYEPGSLTLLLAPALRQSKELFRKVIAGYRTLGRPVPADAENKLELELVNGSRIVSLPGQEETVRSFSGVRLLVIDEAARVPDDLYRAVRPMLATSGGWLIGLTTPWGRRGWFFEEWENGGPAWRRVKVPASACPRITPAFLAEERASLGEWWYRQEYDCDFVDAATQLFTYDQVMGALSADVLPLWGAG